jgi:hypothetical protein
MLGNGTSYDSILAMACYFATHIEDHMQDGGKGIVAEKHCA